MLQLVKQFISSLSIHMNTKKSAQMLPNFSLVTRLPNPAKEKKKEEIPLLPSKEAPLFVVPSLHYPRARLVKRHRKPVGPPLLPSIISALAFPRIAQFFRGKRRRAEEQKPRAECAAERMALRRGPRARAAKRSEYRERDAARGLKRSERERASSIMGLRGACNHRGTAKRPSTPSHSAPPSSLSPSPPSFYIFLPRGLLPRPPPSPRYGFCAPLYIPARGALAFHDAAYSVLYIAPL